MCRKSRFWSSQFKRDRTSTNDEPRSGHPETATSDEIVDYIHDLVLADRRLKLKQIAEKTGSSEELVDHMLYEILGMKKLLPRFVPCLLTPEQKLNWAFWRNVWSRFNAIQEISSCSS